LSTREAVASETFAFVATSLSLIIARASASMAA
jgi:hypothetical protein